jgi:4-hydroxybenzoate polyprenyltransferase
VGRVPVGDRRDLAVEDGDAQVIGRTAMLLARMTRPRVVVTMWTFMLIGLARHAGPTIGLDLVAATVALAASYAVATSLNDVADVEIDRTNGLADASRPLALGVATTSEMRRVAGVAGVAAFAAAVPLGPAGVAVIGLCLAVDVCYSVWPARLSRRWRLAPVALTIAYVVLPYWLGIVVAHDRWRSLDVGLVIGLCVLFFARIILKDVRDRLGDSAHGKPTLLLRLGKDATCTVSIVGAGVGVVAITLAIAPPAPVGAALGLDAAAIVWMLARLRRASDPIAELVTIGTAARAGNVLLISTLAWLLLSSQGADPLQASMLVATLTAVGGAGFLGLALHPARARIAYKAPASA